MKSNRLAVLVHAVAEVEMQTHSFFTSALRWIERSASRSGLFNPRRTDPLCSRKGKLITHYAWKFCLIVHVYKRSRDVKRLKIHRILQGKGKAFPLQAWTGPWGSRRLRLQNF
jgi:hypothetical protein